MNLGLQRLVRVALVAFAIVPFALRSAPAAPGEPVDLTAILPLTGAFALAGQSQQRGLQVLQKLVNDTGGIQGRPLRFQFLDDQSNPQTSVQLTNTVVAQGAQVFLGGASAATCRATAPLVQNKGPVLYCISPAVSPEKGSYVFSAGVQPYDELTAALRFFRDRGWKKIAFIATNDASGQEADSNFRALMKLPENAGLQIVAYEHFAPGDVSVSAQVAKIKASGAQALVVWAAGVAIATVFHGLHDADLNVPVVTSFAMQEYSAMDQFASILPAPLYFASSKWPAYELMRPGPVKSRLEAFFRSFKAAKIEPDAGDQLAWDPALIIVDALRKLGPNAKAEQIQKYIESLHGFAGTSGTYDFVTGDQRGLGRRDVILSEWTPSKRAWIAVSDAGGVALKPGQKVSGS